jgi:hypothetical protein
MAALVGAAGLYGCTLLFPVSGLSNGGPAQPVTVAPTGMVGAPTGDAQQAHAFWAAAAQEWVVVYVDDSDPMSLQSIVSSDFKVWNAGASQAIHGPIIDGRDFSVAYRALGGGQGGPPTDVVHVSVSERAGNASRLHEHDRAHFDGMAGNIVIDGTVSFKGTSSPQPELDPDAPSTAITRAGLIVDMTSWNDDSGGGAGDPFAFVSTSPDPGSGAWPLGFDPGTDLQPMVTASVNSRIALPLDSGDVLAFWDKGDQALPTNVYWARYQAGTWSPFDAVFDDTEHAAEEHDDWSVVRRLDSDVHAVRRTKAGVFEHLQFNGTVWNSGAPIPAIDAVPGGGVVLTSDGSSVSLFVLSSENGNPIQSSTWKGSWSDWKIRVEPGAARSYLTAAQTPPDKVALFWTEATGSGNVIEGALLTP